MDTLQIVDTFANVSNQYTTNLIQALVYWDYWTDALFLAIMVYVFKNLKDK